LLLLVNDAVDQLKALAGSQPTHAGSVQQAAKPIRSETIVVQREEPTPAADSKGANGTASAAAASTEPSSLQSKPAKKPVRCEQR
jgi:hypothetical protein